MTEKIEWYKEVLELEPNSKVFFPLARLLAEDGQITEAIAVLETGLERHAEYLEARLFLIEMLHENGFEDKCESQVDILSKMFASYAGFWQAWAACLSSEKEADTASVLRFLAAQFVTGPIQLHDVLNRGLDTFFSEARVKIKKHDVRAEVPVAGPASAEPEVSESPVDVAGEDVASPARDASMRDIAEESPVPPETLENAVLVDLASPDMSDATPECALPPEPETEDMPPAEESPVDAIPVAEDVPEETGLEENAAEDGLVAESEPEAIQEVIVSEPDLADLDAVLDEAREPESRQPVSGGEESMANMRPDTDDLDSPTIEESLPGAEVSREEAEAPVIGESLEEPVTVEPDEPAVAVEEQCGEEALPEPDLSLEAASAPGLEEAVANLVAETEREEVLPEPDLQMEATELPAIEEPAVEMATDTEERIDLTNAVSVARNLESEAGETEEEQFSLRTRSMAEVLAEQGDIQGALDIYHELAAAAPDKYEAEDIKRRIATLKGRLNVELAGELEEAAPASKSRDRLITMLEALANRVEERAQSYDK